MHQLAQDAEIVVVTPGFHLSGGSQCRHVCHVRPRRRQQQPDGKGNDTPRARLACKTWYAVGQHVLQIQAYVVGQHVVQIQAYVENPPTPRPPRNDDGVQHVVQTQAYFSYKLLQQQEKIKK